MKRKVLVLEDEESIRSFLVLNMKRGGYEVIEAETGEQALEKYHENPDIAVAILDVMLPGIDGYEVCRTMRAEGYQAGVIMLTARTQEADKIELTQIEYGLLKAFMQNIGKALSRDELLEMVWGHHYVGELKIVDVNIRRLRIKIEDDPAEPSHIVTVRGYGYMWEG